MTRPEIRRLPATRWLADLGGAWHLQSDPSCDCRQCEARRATTPPLVHTIWVDNLERAQEDFDRFFILGESLAQRPPGEVQS